MKKEELVIEPIIAYRAFSLTEHLKNKYVVSGVAYSIDWKPGRNKAVCSSNKEQDHSPPELNCMCGFYGFKYQWDMLTAYLPAQMVEYASSGWISNPLQLWGIVEFTGKVIEHETGYRAEFAEIKKLIHNAELSDNQVKALKKYYEVPVVNIKIISRRCCFGTRRTISNRTYKSL